jgi:hypothetical protein
MFHRLRVRIGIVALIGLAVATLGVFCADGVRAQQGGKPINIGDTVEGNLDSSHYQDLYTLTASAGDSVIITMSGSGGLDSYLILQSAAGKSLTEDDDSGGAADARLKYTFTEAGAYTIVATRSGQQGGPTSGAYTLRVENANAPAVTTTPTPGVRPTRTPRPTPTATPDPFVDGGEVIDGSTATGSIDDQHIYYVYTFEGTANLQLTVTVEGQGGLRPKIVVVSATARQILQSEDAPAGSAKVTLEVSLPEDGNYLIFATRFGEDQGKTHGSFTLTVAIHTVVDQVNVRGTAAQVMANLVAAGLAPKGGKLAFTLPAGSYFRASTSGLKYQAVNADNSVMNLVLYFQVIWTAAGDRSGCGMMFRRASEQDYSLVLVTNDRKVALIQAQGNTALINYVKQSILFKPKEMVTITLIVIDKKVTLYVNGKFQTAATGKAVSGDYGLELYNASGNTQVTNCSYPTGWVWSFDQ